MFVFCYHARVGVEETKSNLRIPISKLETDIVFTAHSQIKLT